MDDDESLEVSVPLVWVGEDELPVLASNQVVTQVDQDGVYLVFGHAAPPMILGDAERRKKQVQQLTFVQVRPLVRLAVSRRHLAELIDVLQTAAGNYDKIHGGES